MERKLLPAPVTASFLRSLFARAENYAAAYDACMKDRSRESAAPRIANRAAFHEHFIESKLECGMALLGSEVKSLRLGHCQLKESFARIDGKELFLYGCHIDPYKNASIYSHEPTRPRKLLVHRRELHRLEEAVSRGGMTLIPLAVYFKDGRAKVELGVAHGKKQHDKRDSIKRREQDRDIRRAMTRRE